MSECSFAKEERGRNSVKVFYPTTIPYVLKSLDMVYETVYKGHMRIDDTGKPYFVDDYTECHSVATLYKVFYTLSLFCGFRKGETLALKWSDIDFQKREIAITKSVGKTETGIELKKPKTATSVRKVPFPEQIVPVLKEYRKEYYLLRLSMGSAWKGDDNLFIQADGTLMGRSTPYQFLKGI